MTPKAQTLQKSWNVAALHVLYHHEGTWYHVLRLFPAALFDANGYVRFESRADYLAAPNLRHGAHLHVVGGIRNMPGYIRKVDPQSRGQPKPTVEVEGARPQHESSTLFPDEVARGTKFREGSTRTVTVNVYERDPRARAQCLVHHGVSCAVCDMNFETTYGPIGSGFIHVHHLRDLASIAAEYDVDPKEDLRPVCPNCHSMLHRRTPPYSIAEMKQMFRR
jgi:hypothetical protein